jgi:hypothetical protein
MDGSRPKWSTRQVSDFRLQYPQAGDQLTALIAKEQTPSRNQNRNTSQSSNGNPALVRRDRSVVS